MRDNKAAVSTIPDRMDLRARQEAQQREDALKVVHETWSTAKDALRKAELSLGAVQSLGLATEAFRRVLVTKGVITEAEWEAVCQEVLAEAQKPVEGEAQ